MGLTEAGFQLEALEEELSLIPAGAQCPEDGGVGRILLGSMDECTVGMRQAFWQLNSWNLQDDCVFASVLNVYLLVTQIGHCERSHDKNQLWPRGWLSS